MFVAYRSYVRGLPNLCSWPGLHQCIIEEVAPQLVALTREMNVIGTLQAGTHPCCRGAQSAHQGEDVEDGSVHLGSQLTHGLLYAGRVRIALAPPPTKAEPAVVVRDEEETALGTDRPDTADEFPVVGLELLGIKRLGHDIRIIDADAEDDKRGRGEREVLLEERTAQPRGDAGSVDACFTVSDAGRMALRKHATQAEREAVGRQTAEEEAAEDAAEDAAVSCFAVSCLTAVFVSYFRTLTVPIIFVRRSRFSCFAADPMTTNTSFFVETNA